MEQKTKYAVVQFETEPNTISVVPTNWIFDTNKCYWPKGIKNIRTQIMKRSEPTQDWTVYECTIFERFDTYEEALLEEKRAVISSESEADIPRSQGKRKIKHKVFNSFTPPPSLEDSSDSSDQMSKCDLKELNGRTKSSNKKLDKQDVFLPTVLPTMLHDDNSLGGGRNSEDILVINEEIMSNENVDTTITIDSIPTVITNENFQVLMEHILEMKSILKLILHKVNLDDGDGQSQARLNSNILEDSKIKNILPLDYIEQLLCFEEELNNVKEVSDQLFNKVLVTGGRDYKDVTKRSLGIIFTNNLASKCSWTGQKNNFKISDTRVIKVVKGAIQKMFPTVSDKEFEIAVMNWFRFARQRLERK